VYIERPALGSTCFSCSDRTLLQSTEVGQRTLKRRKDNQGKSWESLGERGGGENGGGIVSQFNQPSSALSFHLSMGEKKGGGET